MKKNYQLKIIKEKNDESGLSEIEKIAREYEQVNLEFKLISQRKNELEKIIKKHLDEHGLLTVDNLNFYYRKIKKINYPVNETIEIVNRVFPLDAEELAEKILRVDRKSLRELIAQLDESEKSQLEIRLNRIVHTELIDRFTVRKIRDEKL